MITAKEAATATHIAKRKKSKTNEIFLDFKSVIVSAISKGHYATSIGFPVSNSLDKAIYKLRQLGYRKNRLDDNISIKISWSKKND